MSAETDKNHSLDLHIGGRKNWLGVKWVVWNLKAQPKGHIHKATPVPFPNTSANIWPYKKPPHSKTTLYFQSSSWNIFPPIFDFILHPFFLVYQPIFDLQSYFSLQGRRLFFLGHFVLFNVYISFKNRDILLSYTFELGSFNIFIEVRCSNRLYI